MFRQNPLISRTILLFLLAAALPALAQPDTLWTRYVPTDSATAYLGGAEAANGDLLLTGVTGMRSSGEESGQNIIVSRLTASGAPLWHTVIGGSGFTTQQEQGTALLELPTGDLLVTGWQMISATATRGVILRLSATGTLVDNYFLGGADSTTRLDDVLFTTGGDQVAVIGTRRASSSSPSPNMLFSVRSFTGAPVWSTQFGMTGIVDYGMRGVAVDSVYYLSGYRMAGSQNFDFWLLRATANGAQDWGTSYSHTGPDELADLTRSVFGDLLLCGATVSGTNATGYAIRVSENGFRDWQQSVVGPVYSRLRGVAARPAGGAICVGTGGSSSTSRQFLLQMITSDGTSEGVWQFGPADTSGFHGIISLSAGGWLAYGAGVVNGRSQGYLARYRQPRGLHGLIRDRETDVPVPAVRVQRLDSWEYTLSTAAGFYALELPAGTYDLVLSGPCVETDTVRGVVVTEDPDLTIDLQIGVPDYAKRNTSINLLAWNEASHSSPVYLYNAGSGNLEFEASVETVAPPGNWLSITPAAGVVAAHDSFAVTITMTPDTTNDGVFDYSGLLHLRTNSCPDSTDQILVLVTVLDARDRTSPTREFRLFDVYPNPFNAQATIRYELARDTRAELRLFDVHGRAALTLVDAPQAAGLHAVTVDGARLATGVYFVVLRAAHEVRTTKLLLLK